MPEEQPEGMVQELEEPNREEKQRSGVASVHFPQTTTLQTSSTIQVLIPASVSLPPLRKNSILLKRHQLLQKAFSDYSLT